MIRVIVMTVLLAGITTGCGRYYWSRPGGTFEQFDRDHLQCTKAAMGPDGILVRPSYRDCLTARGWVRAKQLDPPSPGSFRGHE